METLLINSTIEAFRAIGIKRLSKSVEEYFSTCRVPGSDEFRVLQSVWEMRKGWEKPLASPLFPIIASVVVYLLCMVPWMVIDLCGKDWKWIQRYKIQPNKEVTWPQVRKAITLTMWNHVLYILPVSIAQLVWTADTPLPAAAPKLWEFCWQQYFALVIFDAEYYAWHFVHHKVRFLYRHVHSVHHEYHSPSVWVTQYLHPWELISVGVFSTTSPWWFSGCHPMTQWSFMLFSIYVSVEAHTGFDLPYMPHRWAPFWGGAIKHDMHHQRPRSNYQPFFNWWDRLFGTECPGQLAGGYKTNMLMDWEKRQKEIVAKRIAMKHERERHDMVQMLIQDKLEDAKSE
jgi:cholesterol 25-hydroxylase